MNAERDWFKERDAELYRLREGLGTRLLPLDIGCDMCKRNDVPSVLTVQRFGVIARRCSAHARGLRGEARRNRDGSYVILLDEAREEAEA